MIFDLQLNSRQPLATKLLEAAVRRGRVANAYLLTGRSLDDKWRLARQTAAFLNCLRVFGDSRDQVLLEELPNRRSCLVESPEALCQNCDWIMQNSHPQAWFNLSGEKIGQKVPVDKARALVGELQKTSRYFRVVVIPEADEEIFHRPAANALLKSIEQPPAGNCLFFMFATNVEAVLPTIVSRAQTILVSKSAALALWSQATSKEEADLEATLQAVRAKLVGNARRAWTAGQSGSFLKAVCNGQELLGELNGLLEDGAPPGALVDIIADSELEVLRTQALDNDQRGAATYLSELLVLSENTKEQMEHYVKPTTALESFVYSLNNLRAQYQGEGHLAKP